MKSHRRLLIAALIRRASHQEAMSAMARSGIGISSAEKLQGQGKWPCRVATLVVSTL
jgi:hypothetical protein